MSKLYTDAWKETLQNLSGKTIDGEYQQLVDLLDAFNATYVDNVTLSYAMNDQADSHDEDKLPQSVTVTAGSEVNVDFSTYPSAAQENYDFVGWSTDPTGSVPEYTESGINTIVLNSNVTLFPIYEEHQSSDNSLTIVNNSSDTIEIYYEEDKSEYGNTFIYGGSTEIISLDTQYPYYLRYSHDSSSNSHYYNGIYQGNSFSGNVGYYDENIQPPEAIGSATEWRFYDGDGGTLTISSSSPSENLVTYDGTNPVAYGNDADNLIQY